MYAMSINFKINFQIDQILNLIDVYFHVKIKIKKLNIYHHFFVMNRFDYFFIFEQFFLTAVSINYDYRTNDIYAICTNSEMTRFAIIKIMNRFDRLNKNRIKMYDFFVFLKKNNDDLKIKKIVTYKLHLTDEKKNEITNLNRVKNQNNLIV